MWCWVAGFLASFVVACVVRVVFGIAVDFVFCWAFVPSIWLLRAMCW